MILAPIQINPNEYIVICCLEDDNLERIILKDPAELQIGRLPEPFKNLKLKSVHLTYMTAKEKRIAENMIANREDVLSFLKKMGSGCRYRPEMGDSDLPTTSLYPKN